MYKSLIRLAALASVAYALPQNPSPAPHGPSPPSGQNTPAPAPQPATPAPHPTAPAPNSPAPNSPAPNSPAPNSPAPAPKSPAPAPNPPSSSTTPKPASSSALLSDPVTIFSPPTSWKNRGGVLGRGVLLNQNCEPGVPVTLATYSTFDSDGQALRIFESKDSARSWKEISQVHFNGNTSLSGGVVTQPWILETSQPHGEYPAGTVLVVGNYVAEKPSTCNIQLYASKDKGYTWKFASTVVACAPPSPEGKPSKPVWEPFILEYKDKIAVYFSDETDLKYSQKISHRESTDLTKWSDSKTDVTNKDAAVLRPGMMTIAQIGNKKWIATYEVGPFKDDSPWAVYYRIADDPWSFEKAPEFQLISDKGAKPYAGPHVVWTPAGGENGTIVVSATSEKQLFLNTANGLNGSWTESKKGYRNGYSSEVVVVPGFGGKRVQVYNGGSLNQSVTDFIVYELEIPGKEGKGDGANGFAKCLKKP